MKNVFRNTASLDKLRGQLTKKNVTSLLILPAIIAALFITPTIALASSNVRDAGPDVGGAGGAIPSPSNRSSTLTTLTSIHMLDRTVGWALGSPAHSSILKTEPSPSEIAELIAHSSILKTVDGGHHWQNVTPANAFSNVTHVTLSSPYVGSPQGDFLNDQDAWVATPAPIPPLGKLDTIKVLRTTDGGKSWQSMNIQTPAGSVTDMPHFLNPSDGWLQTFGQPGTGVSAIFHTTDGGLHWNEPGKLNTKDIQPLDVSFSDDQNGWGSNSNSTGATQPLLEVTHDRGKTWQSQSLPSLPGAGKSDLVSTDLPVFSGNNGLLPVRDQSMPQKTLSYSLDLYMTHNGGQTWTPTKLVTSNGPNPFTVDITDIHHVWAANGTNLYATSDGGQSWTKLPPTPQPIFQLDFIDFNNGWAISASGMTADNTKNQPPNLLHTTDGGHTWQLINYSIVGKPI